MRRATATAAALGAVLLLFPAAGPATGGRCPDVVAWRATSYKAVATHADLPLGRMLGKGTLRSSCRTTNGVTTGGERGAAPGITVKRRLYAVDGLRPRVAVATPGRRPALYVSRTPATASELRVLRRLRGG
jgi:hypothetical protein